MASDRFNFYGEAVLALLRDILRATKQQSTYLQNGGNLWLSGDASAAVGVSGVLGGISVLHDFVGSVTATATVSGNMLTTWGIGISEASSSAVGSMSIGKDLQASATGPTSGASGIMVFMHQIAGTVAAISTVSGAMTITDKNLAGSVSAVSFVPAAQLYINGEV